MSGETLGQFTTISTVLLTSGILVLVGLLLAGIGWFQGHGARAAANWNAVQGQVLESVVEQYQYSSDDGTSTGYRARVIYGYRVGGRDYVGERINFGSTVHSSIKSLAENQARKFPTGSSVRVYYNPKDPNDAALEKSTPASLLLYVIGGIMFLVALVTCMGAVLFSSMFTM
ncbi:MAG: DUF3592 domain-containing protein [Anaerolineae bacterium]|nr:DUF3592 domain-containing protein [Anaerolineae bacterium]